MKRAFEVFGTPQFELMRQNCIAGPARQGGGVRVDTHDEYPSRGGTARLPPWRLMTHPLTASSAEVSSSPPEIDESEIDESDE